jgi:hypothetical protein
MTDRGAHWNETYTAKAETQVSWYQPSPDRSLGLIKSAAPDLATSIIDVGGGASRLAGALVAEGYSDITVLDISEVALGRAKRHLGGLADRLSWIVADITQWQPQRSWGIWHDRAVFHFFVDAGTQDAYIAALRRGTVPGSVVIMATFALAGPERCSGLPVQRYSPATLAARLGAEFSLYTQAAETHATPFGTTQEFAYAAFRRR